MLQNKEKVNIDWHSQLAAVSKEGLFLLMTIAAIFLLLALMSYAPDDPGWRQLNTNLVTANLGGKSGAFLADLLFSLWGYGAYLLAILPILKFWQRFKQPQLQYGLMGWTWRLMGVLFILFSSSVLIQLYDGTELLPAGAGGAVGSSVSAPLVTQFGFVGASLLGLLGFIWGLTIYADIAWLATLDALGKFTLVFLSKICSKVKRRRILTVDGQAVQAKADTLPARNTAIPALQPVAVRPVPAPLPATKVTQIPKVLSKAFSVKKGTGALVEPLVVPDVKKIKIEPFEKKSLGQVQGHLFDVGELPSINLLNRQQGSHETGYSPEKLEEMSRLLEIKLKDFGVKIEVVAVNPGPVITRFEIQPAPGVKASKITGLAKDLARSLAMVSVRVVEVIAGKSVMGLEIPNENRAMVYLGDVLSSHEFQSHKSPLALALGHDIAGDPVTADLAKMPHLLVAGTTGSGKSVGVNSMLISMLYKSGPEDLRLILVDPKMLELSVYDGIPHLLTPVVTDMKEAANGLRWCVAEMERRYKLMASLGVRNLAGYNKKVLDAIDAGEPLKDPFWKAEESMENAPSDLGKLPYIVVVIDEFADMMMIVGKKVEELIARIAQKARAAGIHLILATQRPSVDVITGLIKANVPTRMAFQVSSRIDSRTILDQGGAEQLLGHGDMLYLPPGTSLPIRVHGAFVDDDEVHAVVADWKKRGSPVFIDSIINGDSGDGVPGMASDSDDEEADALFDEAIAFVTQTRKVSISSVQRKLRIGYNRAARLVESMEQAGVVSTPSQNGAREVLAPPPVEL
ncbi:cell division protein FtsK [Bermanella sp. 47_1433_sub80_T6]|nr:cell division protein FtsK [Bermanella sp. 47_1433_sub80_T6]